ncbi:MAG: sporulation protein YqfD [Lachnospiraceae bacterium]|nr:sporulation protein YqfD [Lachnospiraceae bacterium]
METGVSGLKDTLKHYFQGYLRIRLKGFSPERFLNLCMAKQIEIWDLKYQDDGYQFLICIKDYRRVKPLVRKAQVRLRILGRYGLPFFLYRNRKRKLYATGIVSFFLVLLVMSQFIWDITIEGNYQFTDDTLLHYLDSLNIRYGRPKIGIDCDQLEESIRSDYPEIIWVSARISGTRLMIKVKENEVMSTIPQKDNVPRDLVAEKSGTITRMIIRRGKSQIGIGDSVEEGTLLVRGAVPIYNDSEELIHEQLVRADADIYAITSESYREKVPFLTLSRTETGRKRHGIRLRLGGLSFLWMLPTLGENPWEITSRSCQVTVLGDFYLPIWVDQILAKEYQTSEHFLTEEELNLEKDKIHQKKMENLHQKGVQILQNSVKICKEDSGWIIQGDFLLEEQIGIGKEGEQIAE